MELDPTTVCGLILQIRQFDVKEDIVDPDSGSNQSDSDAEDVAFTETLENTPEDSIEAVIRAEIESMNEEEQAELVALAWIGRGDYEASEFDQAKEDARSRSEGPTAAYLLGQPMLGDLLAEGLAAIGQPCEF
jgi:hypothetical protein